MVGHETSSNALSFAFHLLSTHPEEQAKVGGGLLFAVYWVVVRGKRIVRVLCVVCGRTLLPLPELASPSNVLCLKGPRRA